MPSHPRYSDRSFGQGDPRSNGWFSRRHPTSAEHDMASAQKLERAARQASEIVRRAAERAKRTATQQIAVLDARLGKGVGAKKERKRLKKKLNKTK